MADFVFTDRQNDALDYLDDDHTTEVLFGGAAGGGKSAFGCAWLISQALAYPQTRWLMGRSELKTLKETTLNTFFQVAAMLGMRADVHYKYNQQSGIVFLPTSGSEILTKDLKLYPADPNFDSLGSLEITGAFIDEANQITEKAKNIVKSRIRYKLDENGLRPRMLMTCNPAKNWAYSQFYKPFRAGTLAGDRAFVQSFVTDNPHISKHYIANLQTLDKASRARLLLGDWEYDDDPSALIEYDKILDLFSNEGADDSGGMFLTCDAARYGVDKARIFVWRGWHVVKSVSFDSSSMVALAAEIARLMNHFNVPASNVVIDEDGVGGGCVDILRETYRKPVKGFMNGSKPLEEQTPTGKERPNYQNLKAQCYFRLATRINAGGMNIGPNVLTVEEKEMLVAELEQVKNKSIGTDNKLTVLSKPELKDILGRSPDLADTLMFREYFDLKPTGLSPDQMANLFF